ncbi:MAG TPA: diiron oxygenase [Nocardioides sp.]|nr:diiron oxygenase [Nocardioides sp.]
MTTQQEYDVTLHLLSEASVEKCFNAFKDVDWDDPALAMAPEDERWALPEFDPLSRTHWYRSLPPERQREVGRHRLTAIIKTGSQFEQLLLLGGTQFLMRLRNDNPEFRYFMHELTEETHHIQMFQEFTNRACPEVSGVPRWLLRAFPVVGFVGGWAPSLFFAIILAGEEPIDHVQKSILRSGGANPLLDRIMAIHVAEEARHIGFAHEWLRHHVPELSGPRRFLVALLTPVVMKIGADAILKPSRTDRRRMGVPRSAIRAVWGRGGEAEKLYRDLFADVRMLFDEIGLRPRSTRWLWHALGIEGRPARFRSEPTRASA